MSPQPPELVVVLRDARALIASANNWLARGYGADADGNWKPIGSATATRFSILGAVMRASKGSKDLMVAARAIFHRVTPELFAKLPSRDEEVTHAEALQILDAAVRALEDDAKTFAPKTSSFITVSETPDAKANAS